MKLSFFAIALLPGYASASLTQSDLQRSMHAAVMSDAAYDPDPTQMVPGALVYTDEPEQVITHKKDDVCYVAFRGTTTNLADWMQSFDLFPAQAITSPTGKVCNAANGFHNAYANTAFFSSLKTDIHDCAASCGATQCDVVLTGHSKGGAVAAIAAVDLEDLNPMIITFGQPVTLLDLTQGNSPCDAIDPRRYLRFVNTDSDGDTLEYDIVTLPYLSDHYDWLGKFLLLSANDGGIIAYADGVRDSYPSTALDFSAHFMDGYKYNLESLYIAGTFPIPDNGWTNGSTCRVNTECQSNLCNHHQCVAPRGIGAYCGGDGDCDSGRCDAASYFTLTKICKAQLPRHASCNENSDCLSGKCKGWWSSKCT